MKRVVLLGSGGLSIGQAGEFDYSGTQAVKALCEEGLDVLVVNPNVATVQTNATASSRVFLYPVEPEWVEKIMVQEKADAIVAGFGGQTALNCLLRLDQSGVLQRHGVMNLGTPAKTLWITEDRQLFSEHMRQIGMPVLPSAAASSVEEAIQVAKEIGFPLIIRAAYALGGLGSGFAHNESELTVQAENALSVSSQILLEKSVVGWKEIEYEIMRDSGENAIAICNMENVDPVGIHTGDSIVVTPSQTLADEEYQLLRTSALSIAHSLGIIGECNVQFALNPSSHQFYVIEVNARLSRSSALASKASGYPIAYIAAKVILGKKLSELKNPVTGITSAFYEPALDYVTVKIPRWEFNRFPGISREVGSAMKSVGEVMAIGRNFPEAFQKAVRMVTERPEGCSVPLETLGIKDFRSELKTPTDLRVFALLEAFRSGMSLDEVRLLTQIDSWFLSALREIAQTETEIRECDWKNISAKQLKKWKTLGFGDDQLSFLSGGSLNPLEIRNLRIRAGVIPYVKKIDTTAGEYPSPSNYHFVTYDASESDSLKQEKQGPTAIVLGGGAYRIGSSVEFDWCAVSCSQQLRDSKWKSVMINCNPETVSTDFNSSDYLYFEELTTERILDISEFEHADGVIVSMGGQLPNRLALSLVRAGIRLLGHSPEAIDGAEDREKFSQLLDQMGIDQPRWTVATETSDVERFISKVGYPILVRPSYVLSGAAMKVAFNNESLEKYLAMAKEASAEFPIVLSEYFDGAGEIEIDGVASQGSMIVFAVSEHVENAGTHSGDATLVCPTYRLHSDTIEEIRLTSEKIVRELVLNGPFNIQFLAHAGTLKVIECNARASRSFPFISKVMGLDLARISTQAILGDQNIKYQAKPSALIGVKTPMFSFGRLMGVDPILGVEMASTGEVGCMAPSFEEALLLAFQSSGIRIPKKGILVNSGPDREKEKFLSALSTLTHLKIPIYATPGTASYLISRGKRVETLAWPGKSGNDVMSAIQGGLVDMVINIPKNLQKEELQHSATIRKAAVRFGCSLLTDMEKTCAFLKAIQFVLDKNDSDGLIGFHNPESLRPF